MKTLLKNGLIYDGTGEEPFHGDILIKDEMLEEIGENLHRSWRSFCFPGLF